MKKNKAFLKQIIEGKKAQRRHLAGLSVPEKVSILIRLQKMAIPLLKKRGIIRRQWKLES